MGVTVMLSMASLHLARFESSSSVEPVERMQGNESKYFEPLVLAALQEDKHRLSKIKSHRERAEVKRELLEKYRDYLQFSMNKAPTKDNEILVTVCLWAFDSRALRLFSVLVSHSLKYGLSSPEGFQRSWVEVVADQLGGLSADEECLVDWLDVFCQVEPFIESADLHDKKKARFYKTMAFCLEADDKAAALQACQTARRFGARVKTLLKRLEAEQ